MSQHFFLLSGLSLPATINRRMQQRVGKKPLLGGAMMAEQRRLKATACSQQATSNNMNHHSSTAVSDLGFARTSHVLRDGNRGTTAPHDENENLQVFGPNWSGN